MNDEPSALHPTHRGSTRWPRTSSAPTSPPTTTPTTTSLPSPDEVMPLDEVAILVPAPEGLALWSDGDATWLLDDHPVERAVPDLVGGVLFQAVDPAVPVWEWSDATGRWMPTWPHGPPEPIRHQRELGGANEVAVPTDETRVWLLDSGTIDGDRSDEQVVHPALWQPGITESSGFVARLGGDRFVVSELPYTADRPWGLVELRDLARNEIALGRPSPWCTSCVVLADLAPAGDRLAYVERRVGSDANQAVSADVVLVDTATTAELWRLEIADGQSIDTDGERALLTVTDECTPDGGPVLSLGDEGEWVARLQTQLDRLVDAGLTVDGTYGPSTERAVEQWQRLRGLPATGRTDEATWGGLLPDRSCPSEVLVVDGNEPTGSVRLDIDDREPSIHRALEVQDDTLFPGDLFGSRRALHRSKIEPGQLDRWRAALRRVALHDRPAQAGDSLIDME